MIVSKHICYVKAKPLTILARLMSDVLCMTLLAFIYELRGIRYIVNTENR
jgi:hypothetical protein